MNCCRADEWSGTRGRENSQTRREKESKRTNAEREKEIKQTARKPKVRTDKPTGPTDAKLDFWMPPLDYGDRSLDGRSSCRL